VPDAASFEGFVALQGEGLLRSARLLTGSWHRGEDLTQETLARLFVAWARIREPAAATAYARRTMVRLYVRNRARHWSGEVPSHPLPDVASQEHEDPDTDLASVMAVLPPRQRAVLVLRFYDDLSVADTAIALRCRPGTVKSQTAKALAAIRSSLATVEARRNEDANNRQG
jgi:RNA polymerase sigma-70 factor (sigma-E family)